MMPRSTRSVCATRALLPPSLPWALRRALGVFVVGCVVSVAAAQGTPAGAPGGSPAGAPAPAPGAAAEVAPADVSTTTRGPIAIDVGHSLAAPGATSAFGVTEFEYNRALAREIAAALDARALPSVTIGERGDAEVLRARSAAALSAGAALLLSVHHDSVQPRYLQWWRWQDRVLAFSDRFAGFSLFVSRENPQAELSLRCASAIGAALRAAGLEPTRHHAEAIDGERRPWADERNGVHWYDGLAVLRSAQMPALLLEAGVIVHRREAYELGKPERRASIARAVVDGLQVCGVAGAASGAAAAPALRTRTLPAPPSR